METNLVLSWEKSHFMVQERIVLGHIVSKRGIEVDKAKVDLISKPPPPILLGVSPEYFFAGVCCGGLITLPLQLMAGFLLRERPVVAVATVASAVGLWTVFPYAVAASTALFLFLRRRFSS